MKKLATTLLALMLLAGCGSNGGANTNTTAPTTAPSEAPAETAALPAPRDTTKTYKASSDATEETPCAEDSYSAACSAINPDNLQDYLGRDDVVYIDLRDYADYAKKHLKNFEVIPYFAAIFDAEAGTEGKPQLYGGTVDAPVATYEESDDLLHAMFPQDKTIFLMCQSGGRVAQCMTLLAAKGYDMSKIYNVGGMGNYTSAALVDMTTDNAELTVNATYSFEGLTPVK